MKTALITGANRGLGKGFLDYLVDAGYFVFAGTRSLPPTSSSGDSQWVKLDISHDDSINEVVKVVRAKSSSLDLLINNAGVNKDSATHNQRQLVCNLKDLDRKSMLTMFDVNSISPLIVTQKFLPLLNGNPSFVINISSCRASYHDEYENTSSNYGYRASKSALNMLTFCSLQELPKHIKTFAVHPGGVQTDMNPTGEDLPYDQAKKIIDITRNWNEEFNGKFLRYSGDFYPL